MQSIMLYPLTAALNNLAEDLCPKFGLFASYHEKGVTELKQKQKIYLKKD